MIDAEVWCGLCEQEHPGVGLFCPIHPGKELVAVPAATAVPAAEPEGAAASSAEPAAEAPRTACWRCGAQSTHAANDTCARCHESLAPPALVIDFPAGSVVLRSRCTSAVLGRAGGHGQVFAGHPNVSRRHATVGVDEAGDAWITPIPEAPNGTFVNDREILARTAIGPGDRIRFATDREPHPGPASEQIRQPWRER